MKFKKIISLVLVAALVVSMGIVAVSADELLGSSTPDTATSDTATKDEATKDEATKDEVTEPTTVATNDEATEPSSSDVEEPSSSDVEEPSSSDVEVPSSTDANVEPSSTDVPTDAQFQSVGLIGTVNGEGTWDAESYELTYANGVWSVVIDFTGGTNNFKARVNDAWTISFGNGADGDGSNFAETLTGKYVVSIADGAANGTAISVVPYTEADTSATESSPEDTSATETTPEDTSATETTPIPTVTNPVPSSTDPVPTVTEPTPVKKTTVSLKKSSAVVYRTGKVTIVATVKNGVGATTYKSNNTKIAKVNAKGVVTAVKAGTAKITVTNNGVKKVFTVTVKNPKLNKTSVKLYRTGKYTLKVTGKVGKATFKSSNKKIATVNSKGVIVAKSKGTATVTVKSNGVTLKTKVTVKNPTLNKKSVTIKKNKSFTVKVTGKIGKAKFTSSNKKVATVNSKGKIKAKKAGKTTIKVKVNGVTLKLKVTVK
jgi:uncharacterized protein YjdB